MVRNVGYDMMRMKSNSEDEIYDTKATSWARIRKDREGWTESVWWTFDRGSGRQWPALMEAPITHVTALLSWRLET
jgi:hypothetical protein